MKRLLSLLLCASVFFVFGCDTTPDPVLSVSPESLSFTADGGSQTVQVKANNPWTASASGSGISVNPSSGDGDATVTVTAAAASSTNPVTGSVNFRSEGLSASVSIIQEERKVIQVGEVMTIPAEGGSFAVDIQYNTDKADIDVEIEASAKSWIEFVAVRALQSGKLEFRFAENGSTDPRQGTVTVKDKNGKVSPITLTFVQEEKKVIAVGDVMTIPAEGGTFAVDVQYNTDVVVEVESAAQSWIHFVAVRALTSGKLEFSFDANPNPDVRSGKVTVQDKNGKVSPITLTFVQAEKKVIAVGDVMEIPAEGGTFSVDVQYNTDVVVEIESAAQSWIHFVAVRALTSGKLEFSFDANPNPDVRTGKVIVKDKNGKVAPTTLTFTQAEKKVIAVGDVMEIPAEGGTFAVDVQYNTDVVVEIESAAQSWIHFVAVRALTSGKLEFSFDANPNPDVRTGKVTVKDKNGKVSPITLTFVQEEKKIIAVGDVMEIPAEGGTCAVDVQYNTDVVVEIESAAQSWIHFVAVRALTSGKLEFSFDANPNPDVRTGKVTVKDKNGKVKPIILTFVQEEKKVIAVGEVMQIPAEGGTFEVDVQYNTDVVVEIESAAQSWIHFVAVRALTSGKLEFSFDANPNPDVRSGKVTVKDRNGKVAPTTLTFTQADKKVIAVGEVMEIPAEGGTFAVDVQYNTAVDVEIEASAKSWIHFVAVRALTSGQLEFTFDVNPDPDVRTGKVTVKDKNGKVSPVTLTFVQAAKTVILVGEVKEVPEEGGIIEVDIQYNTDYDVIVENDGYSWINYVKTRSLTNGKLQFQIAPNDCEDIRTGTVTIRAKKGIMEEPVNLHFRQASKMRRLLTEFYYAMDGPNWTEQGNWCTDVSYRYWWGVMCEGGWDKGVTGLQITNMGLKGEIPAVIGEFTDLDYLFILSEPGIVGGLPESIGKLSNLETLIIQRTSMTHLPDVFGNLKKLKKVTIRGNEQMTGPLPESLGSSEKLEVLSLNINSFTGSIPASWAKVIGTVDVSRNCLSGKISHLVNNREKFRAFLNNNSLYQKDGYGFDISDIDIPGFYEWIDDPVAGPDGSLFTFDDVITKSKYTVYVIWASWCPFSRTLMPALKDYYETYRQDGLEVIATSQVGGVDENGAGHMMDDRDGYFKEVTDKGYDKFYSFYWPDYGTSYLNSTPNAEVYDHNGNIVFSSFNSYPDPVRNRFGKIASTQLIPFLEGLFGPATPPDPYESQDYSQDGQVLTLQKATVGKGINIVFMGDAYTDKDMGSGGVYETAMKQAMEQFFAVEPYKTFRNRFNVYAVKVVSKNGRIGSGYTTALGTYFGSNTYVNGDNDKCYEYALKVPGINSREDLLVSVLVNSNHNAGTAILYRGDQSAVARVPSFGNDPDAFGSTLQHEAGGHGFAFLADEYATNNGTPPQSFINEYNDLYDKYGWYSNVDFTSDPAKIRWSAFLNDSRYSGQVGIYEGAALYTNGAWRPTANSIMKDNYGGFNAPSRWAIYKQIMKRSGEEYSWEKFLEYDAVNRSTSANAPKKSPQKASGRSIEHGAPPVVMP